MEAYARKEVIFHCIQYTGDNREKITDALQIPKENCQCWVNEDTKENYLVIKDVAGNIPPKWWLIAGQDSSIDALNPDLFESMYRRVWIKE